MAKKERAPISRRKSGGLVLLACGAAVFGSQGGGLDFGGGEGGSGTSNSVFCSNPAEVSRVNVTAAQVASGNVAATGADKIADINKVDFLYNTDQVEYNEAWDFARAANEFYDHSVVPRSEDVGAAAGQLVVFKCAAQ